MKRSYGGVVTTDVFSGTKPVAEYVGGTVTREYIYSGETQLADIAYSGLNVSVTYKYPDHLSTRDETDASGNLTRTFGHLPFGETWYETGTSSKWKFTTYERDSESNNDYAVFRSYSSRLGRFGMSDPYGRSINTSVPQSWNRFSYVRNAPLNLADHLGLAGVIPMCTVDGPCGHLWEIGHLSFNPLELLQIATQEVEVATGNWISIMTDKGPTEVQQLDIVYPYIGTLDAIGIDVIPDSPVMPDVELSLTGTGGIDKPTLALAGPDLCEVHRIMCKTRLKLCGGAAIAASLVDNFLPLPSIGGSTGGPPGVPIMLPSWSPGVSSVFNTDRCTNDYLRCLLDADQTNCAQTPMPNRTIELP